MWRADRAGSEDDFTAASSTAQFSALPPAHTHRALSVQFKSFDETACFEAEICSMQYGLQEATRRGPSPAAPLIDVKIANAFVVAGIEIFNGRYSVLICRRTNRNL